MLYYTCSGHCFYKKLIGERRFPTVTAKRDEDGKLKSTVKFKSNVDKEDKSVQRYANWIWVASWETSRSRHALETLT